MSSDSDLLRRYADTGDDEPFTEVVRRHVDLIHSASTRLVGGDAHLAQDVTQHVFVLLAQQARALSRRASIVGWLYLTARHTASNLRRESRRRFAREQEAVAMHENDSTPVMNWELLKPALDDAVCQLGAADREAVLVRYFQNKSHREVGEALGVNEDTARKRVDRALDKLRAHFNRRGITVSAALLGTAITAHSVQAAPAGLVTSSASVALAKAGGAGAAGSLLHFLYMSTKTKIALGAVVLAAAAPLYMQHEQIVKLQRELDTATSRTKAAAAMPKPAYLKGTATVSNSAVKGWDMNSPVAQIFVVYGSNERTLALAALIEQTPPDGLMQIIDQARFCPQPAYRTEILRLAYAKWAALEPANAFAHAVADPQRRGTIGQINNVLQVWLRSDPAAALAAADQMTNATLRQAEIGSLVIGLAQNGNVTGALASMQGMLKGTANYQNFFDNLSRVNPEAAWDALGEIPRADTRARVQTIIIRNMADLDPQRALDLLQSLPPGERAPAAYGNIFSAWAKQDPAAALAAAQNLPPNAGRIQAMSNVAAGWAETDPAGVLQWASGQPPGAERTKVIGNGLHYLAQQQPEAAAAYLASMPEGAARNALTETVVGEWAGVNPQAALAWVDKNTAGETYDTALASVMTQMQKIDPSTVVSYLATQPADGQWSVKMQAAITEWARQDPASTLAWVNTNLTGSDHDTAYVAAIGQLALSDPETAKNYVADIPSTSSRGRVLTSLATALAKQNITDALAYVQSLPDNVSAATRRNAQRNVFNTWANDDPAAAAKYFQANLSDDTDAAALAKNIATRWAPVDSAAALSWAEALPAGTGRDQAVATTITSVAAYNPANAWQYVQSLPAETRGDLQTNVGALWALQDPVAMANALPDLPAGEPRVTAFDVLAANWVYADPQAASKWMSTLAVSPERDAAVIELVGAQSDADPASAMNWAGTIANPDQRFENVAYVAKIWAGKNRAAATQAVQATALTDEQKSAVLQLTTPGQ